MTSSAQLPVADLPDDVLAACLSRLPLLHLVQLSTSCTRLHHLICRSDLVLSCVDLSTVRLRALLTAAGGGGPLCV